MTPNTDPAHPGDTRTRLRGINMMIGAALGMITTVMIAYPYAAHFSLPAQIAAHLLLPVAAVIFKLGYVVYLAGVHSHDHFAIA